MEGVSLSQQTSDLVTSLKIMGRGVCRSYYKGHMDKIKGEGGGGGGGVFGWGEVEEWRENADKCN